MRLLLVLTGLLLARSVTPAQKPNILYILADDLGKREIQLCVLKLRINMVKGTLTQDFNPILHS
jgi:hypothetical protein